MAATFTSYPEPKRTAVPDTTGRNRQMLVPGYLTFRLNGQTLRREAVVLGNELFLMFKDRTAGKETYGAGRFLEANTPKDGRVTIDFNQAYNPFCAFDPYVSCPIVPKENSLPIRIEAGEKYSMYH